MKVLSARWVIPMTAESDHSADPIVLEHHSVLIKDDRIVAIMPTEQALKAHPEAEQEIFEDHALLPGFINVHNHAAMTLFRGLADDLPLMEWLEKHIWPAEGQHVDADFVREGTEHALLNMIRSGTTTFSDMYFFPKEVASLCEAVGMRVQICCPVIDFPVPGVSSIDQAIEDTVELHAQYQHHPLVQIAFGPHAPYTVGKETLLRVKESSDANQIPIQMHIHETAYEVETFSAEHGMSPIQALHSWGLLSSKMQAVHMTSLSEEDIKIVAQTGSHVIHCPKSNMKLASGITPIQSLRAAGVNIALGTDGAASNNTQDILAEALSASLLSKVSQGDSTASSAYETLKMLTINGAKALGQEQHLGSLETGKQADMIAVDLSSDYSQPVYHPVSTLIYSCQSSQISDSWVAGKRLLENGQCVNLNEQRIVKNTRAWRQKIQDSATTS
ncbi:MAG: TRZ/ATZ family hydrolase [Pseudomonadota bacterium]|nr:TRZ/ATZ family hydrolase [Pseudomonadota bacterium]